MQELLRLPSPAPATQGIAYDGDVLWVTSCETYRVYAVNPSTGAGRDEATAPGEPFGLTVVGDELRVVVGFGNDADDRYIYRFVPGRGFKGERLACPDLSGAHLAFDGDELFLGQAWNKRILALDEHGAVVHEIPLERRPVGMTIVDGTFYVVTTDDEWGNRELTKVDARGETTQATKLASFPYNARGLAYDGSRFWTTDREKNEIVAFIPE